MSPGMQLHLTPRIAQGLKYLQVNDPVFRELPVYEGHMWPRFEPGFKGLARVITAQQVSMKAANALWLRLNGAISPLTPAKVLDADVETVRAAGLSRQKASCLKGLAQAVTDGTLDISAMDEASDDEIAGMLTALKGIGEWSAQMYLIFALARPDVWPCGDLGIRNALKNYSGLPDRPGPEEAALMRERFSPRCTAASLLLWRLNAEASR